MNYIVGGTNGTIRVVDLNAQAFSTVLAPYGTLATDTAIYSGEVSMGLVNGTTAGTVAVQMENTTGTDVMTVYAGSSCTFQ